MDFIANVSSRLVVGQAPMKLKYKQIQPILDMLAQAVESKRTA